MRYRSGFSLVELLVVIGIIGLLLTLLLVAVNHARARARSVHCLNNLRQLSLGVRIYTDQHGGRLPDGQAKPWFMQVGPMLESEPTVFRCPDDPQQAEQSYSYRDETVCFPAASLAGKQIDYIASSELVMIFDAQAGWHAVDMTNVTMVSGSALSMEADVFEENLLLGAQHGSYLDLALPPGEIPGE